MTLSDYMFLVQAGFDGPAVQALLKRKMVSSGTPKTDSKECSFEVSLNFSFLGGQDVGVLGIDITPMLQIPQLLRKLARPKRQALRWKRRGEALAVHSADLLLLGFDV